MCATSASIPHEKLELPVGPTFLASIPARLHLVMISIDVTENNTEVGHCSPWVGLPCWRRRALLILVAPICILKQGFASPDVG